MSTFTNREILANLSDENDIKSGIHYILKKLNMDIQIVSAENLDILRISIKNLVAHKKVRFVASFRNKKRFEEKNAKWLNSPFFVPQLRTNRLDMPGRPKVDYKDMSERSKRKDISQVSNNLKNDPLRILMSVRFAAKKI